MRRAFGVVVCMLFAVLAAAGFAVPASAATGDTIKNFTIEYAVSADGILHVQETIAYHFGVGGRHGIFRDLVVREPYKDDEAKDQKYEVSNIAVQSSDAPYPFSTSTVKSNGRRDETLRIKIGSGSQAVGGSDATYVVRYDVRGALRHFADHSELYWDATGSGWDAVIEKVTVNVVVPQGVQQVQCFIGVSGSTQTCAQKSVSRGTATFGAAQLLRGNQLTIVAGITAGAVQNDTPVLVDVPNWLERNGLSWFAVAGSGVLTMLALVLAVVYRRTGKRRRPPVAVAPPKIPVGEGGLLIDGTVTAREISATLLDLAVRGGIRIDNTGVAPKAVLVDPAVATEKHEQVLLKGFFLSEKPGTERLLVEPGDGDTTMASLN